jgi:hypothetical protein
VKRIALFSAAVLAVSLLAWTGESSASGLRIEPGGLLLQDVPVGEARSVVESSGIEFVVHNRDSIPHQYRVSAHRPSETGNGRWPKGYCEIPDASWIILTPDVLEIAAGSSASFDVMIGLPDDAGLYNQKWAVTLAVESAPVKGSMNVALALYPALQIETQASGLPDARPLGTVAVAPATLVANGEKEPLSFRIYNNDSGPHGYRIYVAPAGGKIPASPGLSSVAIPGLVVPQAESIWIEPGGVAQVLLDVDPVVAEAEGLEPWEQLVFVESESGQCTFVRLQMAAD